jgi:hypothetical protein
MTCVVTLHVTACSGGANLSGAAVTDGINLVYTNAYGEVLIYFDDPVGYAVQVSKSGYVTRTVALYATQCSTTQTFCLDTATSSGGGSSGGGDGGGGISCFIVSAATGSAESEEVVALRGLRDRVAGHSAIAAALIDAIYDEYWQFSPAVAQQLDADKFARQGALMAAVRPLVAWYRLAGCLALDRDNAPVLKEAQQALRDACPRWLAPRSMVQRIAALRRQTPLGDDAPQTLRDLAPHLHHAASLPLVNWAILEPLERSWAIAAEKLDPVTEIGRWLGDAPVDRLPALPADSAGEHAQAVGALLAFSIDDQQRLMQRLQAHMARSG